ncbi:MAG: hypothetical protein HQL69_18565 [Magnetococcales bacterium]|nr:hypothetical protein [Magnetococcales bacterium]
MILEIKGAIAGVTGAMQIAKGLQSVKESFDEATQKMQIVELMEALSNSKIALIEAQQSAIESDKEISSLKEALQEKRELVERNGYYYKKRTDNGEPQGKPYCNVCLQKNGLQILTSTIDRSRTECPSCKAKYRTRSFPYEDGTETQEEGVRQVKVVRG